MEEAAGQPLRRNEGRGAALPSGDFQGRKSDPMQQPTAHGKASVPESDNIDGMTARPLSPSLSASTNQIFILHGLRRENLGGQCGEAFGKLRYII